MTKHLDAAEDLLGTLAATEAYLRVFASMQLSDFATVLRAEQRATEHSRSLIAQMRLPTLPSTGSLSIGRDDATDEILTSVVRAELRALPIDEGPEGAADDTAPLLSDERSAEKHLKAEDTSEKTDSGPVPPPSERTAAATVTDATAAFELLSDGEQPRAPEGDTGSAQIPTPDVEDSGDEPSAQEVIINRAPVTLSENEEIDEDDPSMAPTPVPTTPRRKAPPKPRVALPKPAAVPKPKPRVKKTTAKTTKKAKASVPAKARTKAGSRAEKQRRGQGSASRKMANLYEQSAAVPKIRDRKDRPSAAAIQLKPSSGKAPPSAKILGHEEEEIPLELGDSEHYGYEEDEYEEGDTFGVSLAEDEYEYYDEEEEEELEEEEEILLPEPEPGPSEKHVQQMFRRAKIVLEEGEMHRAIDLLSDVLDAAPEFVDAYVARGRVYLDLGDYARAMSDFTIAEEEAPSSPEPQVAVGDLYFARKDYRKAIEHFNAALKMDENHAMAFCRRGISHYYRKNYEYALQDLHRAREINPEIPNIRTFISMAKKKAKRR